MNQDVDVYGGIPGDALKGSIDNTNLAKAVIARFKFTVKILLEESNIDIRPGMTCRAEILPNRENISSPNASVVFEEITDDDSSVSIAVAGWS